MVVSKTELSEGDYEPITLLITPKQTEYCSKSRTQIKKSTKIYSNITYSNSDINTFSKDSYDNHGVAFVSVFSSEPTAHDGRVGANISLYTSISRL